MEREMETEMILNHSGQAGGGRWPSGGPLLKGGESRWPFALQPPRPRGTQQEATPPAGL